MYPMQKTCRFCKVDIQGEYVKYSTRHHAHFDCFLIAKGEAGLRALHPWQVSRFPYFTLKQFNFLGVAEKIVNDWKLAEEAAKSAGDGFDGEFTKLYGKPPSLKENR